MNYFYSGRRSYRRSRYTSGILIIRDGKIQIQYTSAYKIVRQISAERSWRCPQSRIEILLDFTAFLITFILINFAWFADDSQICDTQLFLLNSIAQIRSRRHTSKRELKIRRFTAFSIVFGLLFLARFADEVQMDETRKCWHGEHQNRFH